MRNHLGSYECKLCLTLHNNEGSYLAHTQGKKHQTNLAKRAAKGVDRVVQVILKVSQQYGMSCAFYVSGASFAYVYLVPAQICN